MGKAETNEIQNYLKHLGKKLGFFSVSECQVVTSYYYNPIYDVIWFYKLDKFNLDPLNELVGDSNKKNEFTKYLPVIAFEIEGSNTSSKNQVGNFLNLSLLNAYLNIVIVNNEKATKEKDTYRRGVKICRTYMEFTGENNFIFLDWEYLKNIEKSISTEESFENKTNKVNKIIRRSRVGGEKDILFMQKLINILLQTGIPFYQNYTPPVMKWQYSKLKIIGKAVTNKEYDTALCKNYISDPAINIKKEVKNIKDIYYLPKIDFALIIYLPNVIKSFLLQISRRLNDQKIYYPILNYLTVYQQEKLEFPYLGIEVESSVNKHLNGGIFNLSHFFFKGILVSDKEGQNHLKTFEKLGINNVYSVGIKSIGGGK